MKRAPKQVRSQVPLLPRKASMWSSRTPIGTCWPGIPDDSAAALLLIEHHWAVPLRDAIARAGGFRIDDGFISPLDLVEIGLLGARRGRRARTGTELKGDRS